MEQSVPGGDPGDGFADRKYITIGVFALMNLGKEKSAGPRN